MAEAVVVLRGRGTAGLAGLLLAAGAAGCSGTAPDDAPAAAPPAAPAAAAPAAPAPAVGAAPTPGPGLTGTPAQLAPVLRPALVRLVARHELLVQRAVLAAARGDADAEAAAGAALRAAGDVGALLGRMYGPVSDAAVEAPLRARAAALVAAAATGGAGSGAALDRAAQDLGRALEAVTTGAVPAAPVAAAVRALDERALDGAAEHRAGRYERALALRAQAGTAAAGLAEAVAASVVTRVPFTAAPPAPQDRAALLRTLLAVHADQLVEATRAERTARLDLAADRAALAGGARALGAVVGGAPGERAAALLRARAEHLAGARPAPLAPREDAELVDLLATVPGTDRAVLRAALARGEAFVRRQAAAHAAGDHEGAAQQVAAALART